jgi:hypothetical protein
MCKHNCVCDRDLDRVYRSDRGAIFCSIFMKFSVMMSVASKDIQEVYGLYACGEWISL